MTDTPTEYSEPTFPPIEEEELSNKEFLQRELSRRELARRYYRRYLYYVFGKSWIRTRMSDFIADEIQRFVETKTDHPFDILVIETPPQHGKSITVTESFPSWYLGKFPKHRIIEISYNFDTAERFGRKNMEKVEEFGKSLFGVEKGGLWTKTEFELSNGWGKMISRGALAGITGNPANLMLIDDVVKNRAEADSQTYRDKAWNEWQASMKSRLAAGAKVICIGTPWHEDDFLARIIKTEDNVRLIRLPVEAEEQDLLGRRVGAALCPELGKGDSWLRQMKASYENDPKSGGLRNWQALYQCSPRIEGGNMINRAWWKYYDPQQVTDFGTTVISVDATFKDGESNDFVAIQVWGKRGIDYYLRASINKHLNFPATVQAIITLRKMFPDTRYVLIEDKANGSAIIQTLQSQMIGVIGVTPKGGKIARLNAVAPAIESGHVYLPQDTVWTEEFIDQFSMFPAGLHDDMVDSCTQALNYMLFTNGAYAEISETDKRRIEEESMIGEILTSSSIMDVYGSSDDIF